MKQIFINGIPATVQNKITYTGIVDWVKANTEYKRNGLYTIFVSHKPMGISKTISPGDKPLNVFNGMRITATITDNA